jgi:hypothetical protein
MDDWIDYETMIFTLGCEIACTECVMGIRISVPHSFAISVLLSLTSEIPRESPAS